MVATADGLRKVSVFFQKRITVASSEGNTLFIQTRIQCADGSIVGYSENDYRTVPENTFDQSTQAEKKGFA